MPVSILTARKNRLPRLTKDENCIKKAASGGLFHVQMRSEWGENDRETGAQTNGCHIFVMSYLIEINIKIIKFRDLVSGPYEFDPTFQVSTLKTIRSQF